MALPLAAMLAIQTGANVIAGQSAQADAKRAREKAEQEQQMMNAIAAFRGQAPQQAQASARPSGRTQGLSLLAQLAPLLGQIKMGGTQPKVAGQ